MKTALVCIAKNEDNYIQEWIDYHIKLGFDTIFVYENNWRCKINHPQVVKIPLDGEVMQFLAYNHFLTLHRKGYDWVGFIDVDEFLVLTEDKSVKNFFERFNDKPGVGVNWFFFGDNNLDKVTNKEYSLLKRFTKRQSSSDKHIKTFLNLNIIKDVRMYVHNSNVQISDQNSNLFSGPFCENCSTKYARLNHYFSKTMQEFKEKVDRGRADSPTKRTYTEHTNHNFNEVEDLDAYNFMYK
jgi:hypothetical protein